MKIQEKSDQNKSEILVVEDSPTQAKRLKYMLEQNGYIVSVAYHGKEALARVYKRKPTVVISDIIMPEMDGYQLCQEIKADKILKDIPIILLTSLSDPIDVIKALECGADNFITKPYDENYLLSRIKYFLINRELLKNEKVQFGLEIVFLGQKYLINADRMQILNLLLSTYETAIQKNNELIKAQGELRMLNDRLEEKVEERTAALRAEIGERQNVEEALRESEERYRTLAESAQDVIFILDREGRYQYINRFGANQIGVTQEEIIGKRIEQIFQLGSAGQQKEALEKVFESGKPFSHEIKIPVPSADIWADTQLVPISVQDGKVRLVMGIARDITERKKAEQEMIALQEQLRQSQKMEAVGQLAGGIAHDFNNLLTVIKGYCQLSLLELRDEDPLKENLTEMNKSAEQATRLTRQILAFSRRQMMEMKVLDLNTILKDLDKMLRRVIGEDVELVTLFAEDLGPVKTDSGQVEQVIMNLAVNARDAMPRGGKLIIETSNVELDEEYAQSHIAVKPGRYVLLAISDTGTGMAPEVRDRVFEPFFTTKEKSKGTGLGLSTVYGIVKQSGGNIWVYSEPNHGTSFKIYLPRVDEAPEELAEEVVRDRILRGGETILLVEDEAEVRKLAVRVMEKHGYAVLEARNGEEALLLCQHRKEPIHLILTDVIMPRMSGPQLVGQISQVRQDFKVLYMSGYSDGSITQQGVLEKRMNYIQKPFTIDGLIGKVREVLER